MSRAQQRAGFVGTIRRLVMLLRVQRAFTMMLCLGLTSIALNVTGPRLLGRATDLIVAGIAGRQASDYPTKAAEIQTLRRHGQAALAGVLQSTPFTPGHGIDFGRVGTLLLITLGVYGVSGTCWIMQGRQATRAIQNSAFRLRAEVEAKLPRLPLSYFDTHSRGEILSRTTNDIDNIVQALQQTMSQLTNSALLIIGVLVMTFWISWQLALITLVAVLGALVATTAIGRRAQLKFRTQWSSTGRLCAYAEDMYAGHAVVKIFDQRVQSTAHFDDINELVFKASYDAQFMSGTIQPAMSLINNLGYVLVAAVGCLRVISGVLSIGDVQAFIQYARQLSGPLTQVTSLSAVVQSGVASAQRVFELLDVPEESQDAVTGDEATAIRRGIRFESVSFSYHPDKPLIEGLTLTIEPGQAVAIVGHTGAGKTTLVNLLLRFYNVDSGRITLDGVDIARMSRRKLRSTIGMVLQDTWLFSGSIADNIGYGRQGASRVEIENVAKALHIDHMIRTLPLGYDTVLDDAHGGISTGEKQLISIARAFIADPPILILDEATSSVDARTELLVRRAIALLCRGRTSFVIAHRMSTVRDADLILVMQHGSIVEHGRHAELLAVNGLYAKLYRSQLPLPQRA